MSEQKFDPLKELANLRNNLSRTIQQGIRNALPNTFPAVDIYELGDNLVVQTESLAGLITDTLQVSVEAGLLIVKGETLPSADIPDSAYLHRERIFGAFERQISLPYPVIATSAKSSLKAGILTVQFSKQIDMNQIVSITPVQE
ncbi:MAG: Hsp20/alpha crystallin family protein [Phototrophicales bacterium]|nr:Hsp20/alpha crystallin family protein [Phototrophicales bacterium]